MPLKRLWAAPWAILGIQPNGAIKKLIIMYFNSWYILQFIANNVSVARSGVLSCQVIACNVRVAAAGIEKDPFKQLRSTHSGAEEKETLNIKFVGKACGYASDWTGDVQASHFRLQTSACSIWVMFFPLHVGIPHADLVRSA